MQGSRPIPVPRPDCGCGSSSTSSVTRRRFVGTAAGAVAISPLMANAQSTPETGQPVATPSGEIAIDLEQVRAVSLALIGGGALADPAVQTLGELISADAGRVASFEELAALDDPAAEGTADAVSSDASSLAEQIVGFWYLGEFDGMPVANRAELFFGLPVWGTLPYITQPTLCKSFGYWAMDVSLD